MISHRNLQVNFEQLMSSLFRGGVNVNSSTDLTLVSWLPSTTTWVWCWVSAHPSSAAFPPS